MQVGQLSAWPPYPPGAEGSPHQAEGTFRRCEFVPQTPQHQAHLLVTITHQSVTFTALYWHPSEVILQRIYDSLKEQSGISMLETGDVELVTETARQ